MLLVVYVYKLKIASFNLRNNSINRTGKNINKTIDIIKNFDVVGMQEYTRVYGKRILKSLNNYKIYGHNESSIITNKKVIKSRVYLLPWIPHNIKDLKISITKKSLMPRFATVVIMDNNICIINTHLDYKLSSVQIRELNKLKKIINKYNNYSIVLIGDFNMELHNKNFSLFKDSINMKYINLNKNTWHDRNGKGKIIDHMFISKDYKLLDNDIVSSNDTSDHDLVYVNVSK